MIDQLAAYAEAGLEQAIVLPSFATGPARPTPQRTMDAMRYMAEELMPALRPAGSGAGVP